MNNQLAKEVQKWKKVYLISLGNIVMCFYRSLVRVQDNVSTVQRTETKRDEDGVSETVKWHPTKTLRSCQFSKEDNNLYWFWLVGWFYGISTLVGYLMLNPFNTNNQFYFKQLSLVKQF